MHLRSPFKLRYQRQPSNNNVTVIDDLAVLWSRDWPANGTVQSFIDHVKCYVAAKLKDQDVHLIFKGYYDYSTKSVTRKDRSTCSRVHQLNRDFQLPPCDIVLSVTKINMQLNKLILEDILEYRSYLAHATHHHQLILTGQDPTLTTISEGQIYPKLELAWYHEEADIVITQQIVMATCHSDSWWCGCLCPARILLSHMWTGFPCVHGFTSSTTNKHWHCGGQILVSYR